MGPSNTKYVFASTIININMKYININMKSASAEMIVSTSITLNRGVTSRCTIDSNIPNKIKCPGNKRYNTEAVLEPCSSREPCILNQITNNLPFDNKRSTVFLQLSNKEISNKICVEKTREAQTTHSHRSSQSGYCSHEYPITLHSQPTHRMANVGKFLSNMQTSKIWI